MAGELKHKTAGLGLENDAEWTAIDAHEADGQTLNDMLYFKGTSWLRATPATILTLLTAQAGATFSWNDKQLNAVKNIQYTAPTEVTIVAGVLTITQAFHTVDTEANASTDDLDTINGGTAGMILFLRAVHADRTVVVKHNTGNIWLPGALDISMDDVEDGILLLYDGSHWCGVEIALTAHVAATDPHTQYQKESEKDVASGYLGLDASKRPVLDNGVYYAAKDTGAVTRNILVLDTDDDVKLNTPTGNDIVFTEGGTELVRIAHTTGKIICDEIQIG